MNHCPVYGAILAAGFGTRLRPLTNSRPKPLVPFLNRPLIDYAVDHLASADVTDFGVNGHHLGHQIPPVVSQLAEGRGMTPAYVHEETIMGTAGGIRGIWDALGQPDGTLVAMNGDTLANFDLERSVRVHRASECEVTLLVRPTRPGAPGGVWLDGEGELAGFGDTAPNNAEAGREYTFMGVQLLDAGFVEQVPAEPGCIVNDVYRDVLEAGGRIDTQVVDDFWVSLERPEYLLETTRKVLDKPEIFHQLCLPPARKAGVYVSDEAQVSDDATLRPPVVVGRETCVKGAARLGPHTVLEGVEVGPKSDLSNTVLYRTRQFEGEANGLVGVGSEMVRVSSSDSS